MGTRVALGGFSGGNKYGKRDDYDGKFASQSFLVLVVRACQDPSFLSPMVYPVLFGVYVLPDAAEAEAVPATRQVTHSQAYFSPSFTCKTCASLVIRKRGRATRRP